MVAGAKATLSCHLASSITATALSYSKCRSNDERRDLDQVTQEPGVWRQPGGVPKPGEQLACSRKEPDDVAERDTGEPASDDCPSDPFPAGRTSLLPGDAASRRL